MSAWEVATWIAVGILIVVPVIVFILFLREAARMLRELGEEKDGQEPGRR